MSEAINSLTSSYSKSDINRKSHSTPGKSNFKKFALLHQNNASSIKLEETLPKTSDLRHSKTDETLKTSDLGFVKSSPSRLRGSNTEKDIKQLFERRSSLLEDDHKNQRSPLEEIQFESSLLRSNQSSIRKAFPKESELLRSEEGRRQRIKLNEENELMRSGSKENSIISPKKYGSGMKRSYNEITSTHEEKGNPDLKRIKESYENEIIDLRAEVRRLKDELDSNEKSFRNQKEKISLLEKENQKLFLDIERANFVKSIDSGSHETKNEEDLRMILNQMMKEKQSVEEQYSDLLSSYSILLEHNKNLTTKFDVVERERDELLGKTMQSSYHSPRADFDKPNLPKNKIDPIKRNSFREREIEVKNKPINITPGRERSLKNENKGVYQSPMPLKNSGIHQRARQLLIEELQDDITNFEERLKASTNSVDDTLNPKLSLSARQKDSKGSSSRTSISQSESKQGADSKRFLIDELSSTRKRDSSRGKAKNVLSIPESEGKQKEKVGKSVTSSLKGSAKPQSNKTVSKETKPPSLPINTQANNQPQKASQTSSAKGTKVPLYSKVNKS